MASPRFYVETRRQASGWKAQVRNVNTSVLVHFTDLEDTEDAAKTRARAWITRQAKPGPPAG